MPVTSTQAVAHDQDRRCRRRARRPSGHRKRGEQQDD